MKSIGKDILILNQLDRGATSTVYLVNSIKNGEMYAAKVYNESSKYYSNEIDIGNSAQSPFKKIKLN